MKTEHYISEKLTYLFFGEKYYHSIKAKKILFDFLVGKDYDHINKNISRLLSADDIFIDIGANMGQYLSRLSKFVKSGKIICVEPIPDNLRALKHMRKILRINNAIIIDKAVSETIGSATINIPRLKGIPISTQATLLNDIQKSSQNTYIIEVKTTTIDQIVESLSLPKVNFIKVDTEGFDSVVLRSGIYTIKKFMPLLKVEENCFHPEMNWLFELGYKAFKFFNNKVILITDPEKSIKYKDDTFLAPEEELNKILYTFR